MYCVTDYISYSSEAQTINSPHIYLTNFHQYSQSNVMTNKSKETMNLELHADKLQLKIV